MNWLKNILSKNKSSFVNDNAVMDSFDILDEYQLLVSKQKKEISRQKEEIKRLKEIIRKLRSK